MEGSGARERGGERRTGDRSHGRTNRSPPGRDRIPNNSRSSRQRSRSPIRHDRRADNRRARSPLRDPPSKERTSHRNENGRNQGNAGNRRSRSPAQTQERTGRVDDSTKDQKPSSKEPEDSEEALAELQRIMGFKSFRSTKNTKVPGNDKNWGVSINKKSEYRQYMNRAGGFNRPLSPGK